MKKKMQHNKQFLNLGLTAIEMMVVIAIVGILATIAFPAYQGLVQNFRTRTLATDLRSTLSLARSEAIKRSQTVTICPTANADFTACGSANDWQNGWIVFIDPNDSGVITNIQDRIKTQDALGPGVNFSTAQNRLSFNSLGYSTNGIYTINLNAPGCTGSNGRRFEISVTGRVLINAIDC